MIFRDDEYSLGGYDIRALIIFSAIDYLFLYTKGHILTWIIAEYLFNILPTWLAFIPGMALIVGGSLLLICGPMCFFYLIHKGWQSLDKNNKEQ